MLQVRHKNHKIKLESSAIDVLIQQKSNARKAKQFINEQSSDQVAGQEQNSSGIVSKLDYSPMVQSAYRLNESSNREIKNDNGGVLVSSSMNKIETLKGASMVSNPFLSGSNNPNTVYADAGVK